MKHKFFFLFVLSLFLLMSCNKDKITLEILSPADGAKFTPYEDIEVNITATTQKGSIAQVILFVDILDTILLEEPYNYIIPKYTFREEGIYFLSVKAYSSEGVHEGAAIDIIIEE